MQSFLITLDPRVKLFALFLLGFVTLVSESPLSLGAVAVLVVAAILMSPISLHDAAVQLRRIFWFVLFITTINAVTTSGTVVVEVGELFVTEEGLLRGVLLSSRVALLLLLSSVVARSTHIAEITDAVETTFTSFGKRRRGVLLTLFGTTLNFIPVLVQSAHSIKAAQIARGADVDSTFFRQLRFASDAALPLFVAAFRSSQYLAEAMDARCYSRGAPRTPFVKLKLGIADWCTIFFLLLLFICLMRLG